MSLEQALAANTAAIEKLTALLAHPATVISPQPIGSAQPTSPADVGQAPAADRPRRGRPPTAATPVPTEQPKSTPPADAPAVKYEDVRAAVLGLAEKKGHTAAVAVLAGLGVKSAKELKPEQYAEALAKCQAA